MSPGQALGRPLGNHLTCCDAQEVENSFGKQDKVVSALKLLFPTQAGCLGFSSFPSIYALSITYTHPFLGGEGLI